MCWFESCRLRRVHSNPGERIEARVDMYREPRHCGPFSNHVEYSVITVAPRSEAAR